MACLRACMLTRSPEILCDLFSRLYLNMAIDFDVPRRYFIGRCLFTFFENDYFDC